MMRCSIYSCNSCHPTTADLSKWSNRSNCKTKDQNETPVEDLFFAGVVFSTGEIITDVGYGMSTSFLNPVSRIVDSE